MIVPKNAGRNLLNKNERKNRINEMFKRNRIERRFKNMKEEKTKKKFNKKLLTFGILGIFALAVVSAGLMSYYGQIQAEINVEQPISVEYLSSLALGIDDTTEHWIDITGGDFTENLNVMAGETVTGTQIRVTNFAYNMREVEMHQVTPVEGISVNYGGEWDCSSAGITEIGFVPAGESCVFSIEYTASDMLTSGTYTVSTTIDPN